MPQLELLAQSLGCRLQSAPRGYYLITEDNSAVPNPRTGLPTFKPKELRHYLLNLEKS